MIAPQSKGSAMAPFRFLRRSAVAGVLAAGVAVVATATPSRASVITDTQTLPLLGVPYVASNGDACFPVAGVCTTSWNIHVDFAHLLDI